MEIKIMIVEDDIVLARELATFLQRWQFSCFCVKQFENVLDDFKQEQPQLVLLDVNLPYYDGFYWCARIREVSHVPILFISSRQDDRDKIMGISQGADDYLDKPFQLDLLKAKIEAILRRTYQYQKRDVVYLTDEIFYRPETSTLSTQEAVLELTKSEKKIMNVLVNHRSQIVSREELMRALWQTDEFISDSTLTVLVSRLRSKIREFSLGNEIIKTKKGQGYYIE